MPFFAAKIWRGQNWWPDKNHLNLHDYFWKSIAIIISYPKKSPNVKKWKNPKGKTFYPRGLTIMKLNGGRQMVGTRRQWPSSPHRSSAMTNGRSSQIFDLLTSWFDLCAIYLIFDIWSRKFSESQISKYQISNIKIPNMIEGMYLK